MEFSMGGDARFSRWIVLMVTLASVVPLRDAYAGNSDRSATDDDNRLPEVTVTAQRREQSIQDVGIAITAYSGEQLRELGFQDSFDIARMTPCVHISGNNGGQKNPFFLSGVHANKFHRYNRTP